LVFNKITRRQALKTLLAAGGGLTTAAFLPSRLLKPVVMSGVLPTHAQGSSSYTSINPALADAGSGATNGHVLNPGAYEYIYYNFGSPFSSSNISAQLIGPNASGVLVKMDIKNKTGSFYFRYYDDPVIPTFLLTFPVDRTADGSGTAIFPFLMPGPPGPQAHGSTFDLNFTYWRGANLLYESNVSFSIA
jgi:hypothetical protein